MFSRGVNQRQCCGFQYLCIDFPRYPLSSNSLQATASLTAVLILYFKCDRLIQSYPQLLVARSGWQRDLVLRITLCSGSLMVPEMEVVRVGSEVQMFASLSSLVPILLSFNLTFMPLLPIRCKEKPVEIAHWQKNQYSFRQPECFEGSSSLHL